MANVALGKAIPPSGGGAVEVSPPVALTPEEQVSLLEAQVAILRRRIDLIQAREKRTTKPKAVGPLPHIVVNKDGLPLGLVCYGITEKSQFPFCLTVEANGYALGAMKIGSLSAAAQTVSGVRRSGWAFWRVPDGRTLKEVYKRR